MTTAEQKESPSTAPPSEIGTVLAQRYEVVRELGRGGMGVVYLCRDAVTGDRVALKRLRTPEEGRGAPEESWWFHQEACAPSLMLDHPWRSCARDFGQLADGSPFFVMGGPAGPQRARVDAHDQPALDRRVGRGRSGPRGPRARARSRRHPRGPQAFERHARLSRRPGVARVPTFSIWAWPGCARSATTPASTGPPHPRWRSTRGRAPWAGSRRSRSGARPRSWVRPRTSTRSGA